MRRNHDNMRKVRSRKLSSKKRPNYLRTCFFGRPLERWGHPLCSNFSERRKQAFSSANGFRRCYSSASTTRLLKFTDQRKRTRTVNAASFPRPHPFVYLAHLLVVLRLQLSSCQAWQPALDYRSDSDGIGVDRAIKSLILVGQFEHQGSGYEAILPRQQSVSSVVRPLLSDLPLRAIRHWLSN